MIKATGKEVNSVVSYIGGVGGYLGDFKIASHAAFYPMFCGLDIDPSSYVGDTTRKKFITILSQEKSFIQAKIMSGVLDRFPLSYFESQLEEGFLKESEFNNKKHLHIEILGWIEQLKGNGLVEMEGLTHTYEIVQETLNQCQTLISEHSCSAIDRAHTALHGYFKNVCKEASLITVETDPKIQDYWSLIKTEHPKFLIDVKQYNLPINQVVASIAKLLENLNIARNKHGFSHPNEDIMGEEEAKLCINLFRSILIYIDRKLA